MQALQAVTLVGRAETLRSAQLPQLMAVAVAVLGQGLLRLIPEGAEVASGQRVQALALLGATVAAAVVAAARQQA